MKNYPISPLSMLRSIWINRYLVWNLTRREVLGRYKGSLMGVFWSFVTPVLMLAVYTFIFRNAFHAKWNEDGQGSIGNFSLVLFVGLIIFSIFSESINRAPTLITSNINFVKKVIFPLDILPIVILGSSLFHAVISFFVWFLAYFIFNGPPSLTALFLPVIVAPLILFTLGLSWLVASLGVYLRDISQVVGISCQALMFLTPIFYPISAIPDEYQWALRINPLTVFVDQTRGILLWDTLPHTSELVMQYIFAFVISWLGYVWFQKTRKGFADVL